MITATLYTDTALFIHTAKILRKSNQPLKVFAYLRQGKSDSLLGVTEFTSEYSNSWANSRASFRISSSFDGLRTNDDPKATGAGPGNI